MDEWNENKSLEWELLEYPIHKNMQSYVKALNFLYREHPALYEEDYMPDGFEWINCMDSANNIAAFLRKTDKPEETLLFVCNFAPVEHEKYKVGVPFPGKYKEIFNSESKSFGGCGIVNPRVKSSKAEECDGRRGVHYRSYCPAWNQRILLHSGEAGEKDGQDSREDGKKQGRRNRQSFGSRQILRGRRRQQEGLRTGEGSGGQCDRL